ncbi:MAG TPA: hypothetical protein VN201_11860 [Roseateles sp.]|nr:hypothetical protein [Roseateles sp.]
MNQLVLELDQVQTDAQLVNSEVAEDIAGIREHLQSLLEHYEATHSAHGIALPYSNG